MAKKKETDRRPVRPLWEFDAGIPTHDFLEGADLHDPGKLQEAVDNFICWLEEDNFLTWEAVACYEQEEPLTARHQKRLDALISFEDSDDDKILYINGTSRPSEHWDVILNKIVPHLLIEPLETCGMLDDVYHDGWVRLLTALQSHGEGLSLPAGVSSPAEVVPTELRHKLWLQYCFDILSGLGQMDELNLDEQAWRIDEFIDRLRECKPVVESMDLTLESMLTRIILPQRDEPILRAKVQEKLGLASAGDRLGDHL